LSFPGSFAGSFALAATARCFPVALTGGPAGVVTALGLALAAPTSLSREAVVLARATLGCLDFVVAADVVAADVVDAARVNVFERWTNREVLAAFRESGPENELGTLICGIRHQRV
jgi:hypothetical protein